MGEQGAENERRPVQGCVACATYRAEDRACPAHRVIPPASSARPDEDGGAE